MWELDYKESWALKNWCFWTVVLEKTPERNLDWKKIQPVNPKGNQPWRFIRRTDAEAEAPTLWLPDVKSWLTEKDPYGGKHWGQEEKGVAEDEMVRWHDWLNGHELEQTPGDSEGQGSLVCCTSWGHKELDTTQPLKWTERVSWWSERREWKSWLKTQYSKNEYHGIWPHHFMVNRWGINGNSDRLYFLGLQNHCRWWLQPWN